MTGLEPAASRSQIARSSQTELHPDIGGGGENRTHIFGFRDRGPSL